MNTKMDTILIGGDRYMVTFSMDCEGTIIKCPAPVEKCIICTHFTGCIAIYSHFRTRQSLNEFYMKREKYLKSKEQLHITG